jgi:transcriptional regulator with XRE-family HTH domain
MSSNLSSDSYVTLVDALAAVRRELAVSQEELARRLGKTQSFVSKIERRQRRIDVVEFIAVAEALGLDPSALLTRLRIELPGRVAI